MAGLPKKYAKMGFKKGWREYRKTKRGGSKRRSSPRKKTTRRRSAPRTKAAPTRSNGKTLTMILDGYAIAADPLQRGIQFAQDGDAKNLMRKLTIDFSGFDPNTGTWEPGAMVKGWGSIANRTLEKKAFTALGIKGPRTKPKTIGDFLDYVTYLGGPIAGAMEQVGNPAGMNRMFNLRLNGVDLYDASWGAYKPMDMLMWHTGPYAAQKLLRKTLRNFGVHIKGLC